MHAFGQLVLTVAIVLAMVPYGRRTATRIGTAVRALGAPSQSGAAEAARRLRDPSRPSAFRRLASWRPERWREARASRARTAADPGAQPGPLARLTAWTQRLAGQPILDQAAANGVKITAQEADEKPAISAKPAKPAPLPARPATAPPPPPPTADRPEPSDQQGSTEMTTTADHAPARRVHVPPDHAMLSSRIAQFSPDDHSELIAFLDGEARGMAGYAEAFAQMADGLLNGTGLAPASVQAAGEVTTAATEMAGSIRTALNRFLAVYSSVIDTVASGVRMPHDGRFFNEGA